MPRSVDRYADHDCVAPALSPSDSDPVKDAQLALARLDSGARESRGYATEGGYSKR